MNREERDELRHRIDAVTRERGLPRQREHLERDMRTAPVRLLVNGSKTVDVDLVEPRPCRSLNCPNVANTRYDRGPYSGLCEETCIPAARAEASRVATERWEQRRQRRGNDRFHVETPPEPEPEADRPVFAIVGADAPDDGLAALAERVEAAAAALEAARAAYREARTALINHPSLNPDLAG